MIAIDNAIKIKKFLDSNHKYILTSSCFDLNISKPLITKYVDSELIKKFFMVFIWIANY